MAHAVVAKSDFVHHRGVGGVIPIAGSCIGGNWITVQEESIDEAAIFSVTRVIAGNEDTIDSVLVIDVVVDFGDSIVTAVDVGESAEEAEWSSDPCSGKVRRVQAVAAGVAPLCTPSMPG